MFSAVIFFVVVGIFALSSAGPALFTLSPRVCVNRGIVSCPHAVRTDRIRDGGSRYCTATCRSVSGIDGSDSVLNKLLVVVQHSGGIKVN